MMCNSITYIVNIKIIFQYLFLSSFIIIIIHSKLSRIHNECDKFLLINDCYYFPCLEAHYSCGRDSHLARFTYDFCSLTTKKYTSQLTYDGQFYFNHTNRCVITTINDQLIDENISEKFTCSHLQRFIWNIYVKCLQNNHQQENKMIKIIDFCSIICENLQIIIDIFLNLHNSSVNLQQLLLQIGRTCETQIDYSKLYTTPSLLIAICLDRKNAHLEQDITNIMFSPRFEPNEYDWI